MRKLLIPILILLMVASAVSPVYAQWTDNQVKANQIANMARSMGLPETSPIITEAGRIWWEEENAKAAAEEAAKQAFLSEHYTDAVMMAKTMYGEAKGISSKRELSMICWTILNRYDTGRYKSIAAVITEPNQFAYRTKAPTISQTGIDLFALAQDVLLRWRAELNGETDVGRTLPPGYCFYYGDGHHNYFRAVNGGRGSLWFEGYGDPYQ